MQPTQRIQRALEETVARADGLGAPPALAASVRHAVFPGGARIRPKLCLAVASACGADDAALVDAAATAIELLHCASLVHDDLPCFDDAPTRRGVPSVHHAFGERIGVLAGDALIVLAFQALAAGATRTPERLPALIAIVAKGVGLPLGIVAGQAWECEPQVDLGEYHRAKTGALFAAATMAGAGAAGVDPQPWRAFGARLGTAYQIADDIRDVLASAEAIGKPIGRDRVLGRPNVAVEHGVAEALSRFDAAVVRAAEAIPPCDGAGALRALVRSEAERLVPASQRLEEVEPIAA